jgi:hypothetical protein
MILNTQVTNFKKSKKKREGDEKKPEYMHMPPVFHHMMPCSTSRCCQQEGQQI